MRTGRVLVLAGAGVWHLNRNRKCAVWVSGFLEFLRAPAELDDILRQLR